MVGQVFGSMSIVIIVVSSSCHSIGYLLEVVGWGFICTSAQFDSTSVVGLQDEQRGTIAEEAPLFPIVTT